MLNRKVRITPEGKALLNQPDNIYGEWKTRVEFLVTQEDSQPVDYTVLTDDDKVAIGKAIETGLPVRLVTEPYHDMACPKLAVIEYFTGEYSITILLDPYIPTATSMERMSPELWVAKRKAILAIIFEANRRHNEMVKVQTQERRLEWIALANQFMPTPFSKPSNVLLRITMNSRAICTDTDT